MHHLTRSSLSSPHLLSLTSFSSPSSARRRNRFPISSLRDTKKPIHNKAPPSLLQKLRLESRKSGDERPAPDAGEGELGVDAAVKGSILAGLVLAVVVGGFGSAGYVFKDQINEFLTQFSVYIEGHGPTGYALFVLVYAGLELVGNASRNMGLCKCRCIWQEESNTRLPGGNGQYLLLGLGLLVTAFAATYVTRLAKDAVKDIE